MKKICNLLLLVLSLWIGSNAFAVNLNFGMLPKEAKSSLKNEWQPIIDDFAKQTGYTVKIYYAQDYASLIQAIELNKVQVAILGNKSALEVVDGGKAEVVAQVIGADGSQGYYSHLIVNKSSPINNLNDLFKLSKQLIFSNGDPNSTSGYLVPGYYAFMQNKIDPNSAFKAVRASNHENNALAIADGLVDVATIGSIDMIQLKKNKPDKFKEIKIIWTSPLIPYAPVVVRSDLPEDVKKQIANFFVGYGKNNELEKENLQKLPNVRGYALSDNGQLEPIRKIDLFVKRNQITANSSLTEEQKREALAFLNKKVTLSGAIKTAP